MNSIVIPPKVPMYWVQYAMEIEKTLRQKTAWHPTIRIKCETAKVEIYFAGNPPWYASVEIIVNGVAIKHYGGQFDHAEGASGYDRVLKSNFQRFNDEVLIFALGAWITEKNNGLELES